MASLHLISQHPYLSFYTFCFILGFLWGKMSSFEPFCAVFSRGTKTEIWWLSQKHSVVQETRSIDYVNHSVVCCILWGAVSRATTFRSNPLALLSYVDRLSSKASVLLGDVGRWVLWWYLAKQLQPVEMLFSPHVGLCTRDWTLKEFLDFIVVCQNSKPVLLWGDCSQTRCDWLWQPLIWQSKDSIHRSRDPSPGFHPCRSHTVRNITAIIAEGVPVCCKQLKRSLISCILRSLWAAFRR